MRTFAEMVVRLRQRRGLSQRQLAQLTCVDPAYVNRIERSGVVPSLHVLGRLAEALGTTTLTLLAAALIDLEGRSAEWLAAIEAVEALARQNHSKEKKHGNPRM